MKLLSRRGETETITNDWGHRHDNQKTMVASVSALNLFLRSLLRSAPANVAST